MSVHEMFPQNETAVALTLVKSLFRNVLVVRMII